MDEIPIETKLQSEIAALKYKNDRINNELRECESRLKGKENTISQLNSESEHLKENLARFNAINNSLQKRLHDLEEREKDLNSTNQRNESDLQRGRNENEHYQERIIELESQLRSLLIDREAADQSKDQSQRNFADFCRKVSSAIDFHEDSTKTDLLLKRIYEIYQENSRFKVKMSSLKQSLETMENENRTNSDIMGRLNCERENLNSQSLSYITTIDQLKREKDQLIAEKAYLNTEVQSYKEKSAIANRTVCNLNDQNKVLDHQIITNKESLFNAEEKATRLEKEMKNFQDSVAIQLSTGSRMVDATHIGIRERIKDILIEIKEKQFSNDQLREKVGRMTETIERLEKLLIESKRAQEDIFGEKMSIDKRFQESDAQLTTVEILNEGLRKDKNRFLQFLEQLGSIMGLDEVSNELGFDLQTDAIVARSEQLAKLEGDRLADKTATVYQLQRRLRTIKEQLEKKDLHLDMLRKKIMVLEESVKMRTTLEIERDEACSRSKKLMKQNERLDLDLKDAKLTNREIKGQLTDAAEYKIISLERARKIEELERRINDLEILRVKYNRKINYLKDQIKVSQDNNFQERDLNDHAFKQLNQELSITKRNLMETTRREAQLLNLRSMIGKLLGIDWSKTVVPDYEMISKLEKIVQTNREFAHVSRKLSDSIKQIPQTEFENDKDSLDDLITEADRRNL